MSAHAFWDLWKVQTEIWATHGIYQKEKNDTVYTEKWGKRGSNAPPLPPLSNNCETRAILWVKIEIII